MKLSEAITLNQESEKSLKDNNFTRYAKAVQLGIEALKRALRCRTTERFNCYDLLPGETEED